MIVAVVAVSRPHGFARRFASLDTVGPGQGWL
jgi:hypothetical protein